MKQSKSVMNAVLIAVVLSLCLMSTVYATEGTVTETIGNLEYEVPISWSASTEESEDTITKSYIDYDDSSVLIVLFLTTDLNEYDETIQRMMLDAAMQSFEDLDGYSEFQNEDSQFKGNVSNVRSFSYNQDGQNFAAMSASMYTGEGIAVFIYSIPTTSVDFDLFRDVIHSLRIADSGEKSGGNEDGTATAYETGMYKVGTDIPAGEYAVFANGGTGYFCVSSDSNQDDILFNDNFDYNSIITIYDGEYLDLSRCYAVPIEDAQVEATGSGMYKVGTHIPAGEYKLDSGTESGYYCIYPDSRQDDIIVNDIFEGQSYVTVSEGQYIVLNRCKFSDPPEKPVKTYTDSDTVKKVQESLNAAGYDCGTPDGIAGSGTRAQIEKFQTDKGLEVTGTITDDLLESLGI